MLSNDGFIKTWENKEGKEQNIHLLRNQKKGFNKRPPLKSKCQIPPLEFISIYFFLIFQDRVFLRNW